MSWSESVLAVITQFGDPWFVLPLTVGMGIGLYLRRSFRSGGILVVGVTGAWLLGVVLKQLVARERPSLEHRLVEVSGYSFPSLHATVSCALALSVVLLMWRTGKRWPVLLMAVIYTLLIGLSRVELGVHYPSDVLGGWIVAAVWVSLVWWYMGYHARHDERA